MLLFTDLFFSISHMIFYMLNNDYVYFHVKCPWITLNIVNGVSNKVITQGLSCIVRSR
jgi:hypothetical protein